MFKKNDILPAILALISTSIVILLGFVWLNKINNKDTASSNQSQRESATKNNPENFKSTPESNSPQTRSLPLFPSPNIVPQGTSVRINGSTRMNQINKALKKSFQRRFPGTAIIVNSDGIETSLELLRSGEIELAAISRPLTDQEQADGLVSVAVDEIFADAKIDLEGEISYYVYREPVVTEVEIFLGYALSTKGQQAITNR